MRMRRPIPLRFLPSAHSFSNLMMKNRILTFLKQLKRNNSREWLAEHKAEYNAVMEERNELTQRLIDAIASIEPEAAAMSVNQCVYRLMRDTRFSEDKTPYKTHIGIFICPPLGK